MRYILEHEEEFRRLENQCKQKHYWLEDELSYLNIFKGAKILDAGCGSGILSRYLSTNYADVSVSSCDFSDLRLKQARDFSKESGLHHISFFQSSLDNIKQEDETFDFVICRYVYEYLTNPIEVTKELARVLKPGGTLCLIDLDGVFLNFHSNNPVFEKLLTEVKNKLRIDLFVGRKLHSYMHAANLSQIKRFSSIHDFQNEDLEEEYENARERLRFAKPDLLNIFGNDEVTTRFCNLYLEEMKKNESTLFHNKFIVIGTK